jgi:ElaB/YqjD/DUF883 family membrane-anchored ribosome-binding protein
MNEERPERSGGNGDWDRGSEKEGARSAVEETKRQAEELAGQADDWLRSMVRERPFAMVAAAVAGGFLIGRLLSRR